MANNLANGHQPISQPEAHRFLFYDSILLRILKDRSLEGREIFKELFEKNKASAVLKFLDNETSLPEELAIISSLPTMPFLKAAIRHATTI